MCGHCRTIVAGAFVVGSLVGFLASNVLLNKKYKAIYEAESEKTVEAGKRVVKGLKEKLAKYEATEEEYRRQTENYISDSEVSFSETEKIPEGNSEEANSEEISFITEEEFNAEWPEEWEKTYFMFGRTENKWFLSDGKSIGSELKEDRILMWIGPDILKEVYKKAGLMRKPVKNLYVYNSKERTLFQIILYQTLPVFDLGQG